MRTSYVIRRLGGYIVGEHDTPFMHPGDENLDYEYTSRQAAEEALEIHAKDFRLYTILKIYQR